MNKENQQKKSKFIGRIIELLLRIRHPKTKAEQVVENVTAMVNENPSQETLPISLDEGVIFLLESKKPVDDIEEKLPLPDDVQVYEAERQEKIIDTSQPPDTPN